MYANWRIQANSGDDVSVAIITCQYNVQNPGAMAMSTLQITEFSPINIPVEQDSHSILKMKFDFSLTISGSYP